MQLSYVIISYNECKYLAQAIESCLQQPIAESEIIIADDGSSDGSIELIQEYAAKYPQKIRYFVNDRSDVIPGKVIAPIRVSNNLKRSLAMAKGRYCQLLSGDDYLLHGNFSTDAIDFLDKHPGYSAYVGAYEKVWEDRPKQICRAGKPTCLYWAGDYLHLTAFIFRRSLFDIGLLPRFCDDTGLHYTMAVNGKLRYCDEVVMAYRQRSGSIMHESDPLELSIMELMLLQDVLSVGKLYAQTLVRFAIPLLYVFQNREKLKDPKYQKYLENCASYPHDVLAEYASYDQLPLQQKVRIRLRLEMAQVLKKIVSVLVLPWRLCKKIERIILKK